jgi:hypothetical protein
MSILRRKIIEKLFQGEFPHLKIEKKWLLKYYKK